MSELIVIGTKGREKYRWDTDSPESLEEAKKVFENKLAEGYAAFKILQVQDARMREAATTLLGEQLHEFDPKAETIQMTPPLVGG